MRNSISKTIVAGLTSLAIAAAVVLPASPASAAWGGWHGGGFGGGWHGGGWGGGGGWHGGGWRGGGWNGGWGGWRGAGWNGGWGGWRGGCWGGWGCGGWWGPAFASGVALGAVGTYPYWGGYYGYPYSGYGYGYGCWRPRPIYSAYGRYLGRRWVNVC